jgi:hypothetical protein
MARGRPDRPRSVTAGSPMEPAGIFTGSDRLCPDRWTRLPGDACSVSRKAPPPTPASPDRCLSGSEGNPLGYSLGFPRGTGRVAGHVRPSGKVAVPPERCLAAHRRRGAARLVGILGVDRAEIPSRPHWHPLALTARRGGLSGRGKEPRRQPPLSCRHQAGALSGAERSPLGCSQGFPSGTGRDGRRSGRGSGGIVQARNRLRPKPLARGFRHETLSGHRRTGHEFSG